MDRYPIIALLVACTVVSGCAAMHSTKGPGTTSGGLLYYMPNRDIVITVTNANGKVTSITATPSIPYADRSTSFLLQYQAHLLAKNTMDIDVSEAGLLTSSKANQTGDAVAALGGLGTLGGYLRGNSLAIQSAGPAGSEVAKAAPNKCTFDGNHTYMFKAEEKKGITVCDGITVDIARHGWTTGSLKDPGSGLRNDEAYPGVFYRNNLPYKVTITSPGLNTEAIVHSPSESGTHFLPLARTVFANNDAKITLSNGAAVPSKYVQDTDGEGAALLKIPAAILTPYFAAIGQMFTWRGGQRTSQTNDMTSALSLELAKIKYQKCIDAIEAKDTELIASLKCQGS
jgi:hypothetical protein